MVRWLCLICTRRLWPCPRPLGCLTPRSSRSTQTDAIHTHQRLNTLDTFRDFQHPSHRNATQRRPARPRSHCIHRPWMASLPLPRTDCSTHGAAHGFASTAGRPAYQRRRSRTLQHSASNASTPPVMAHHAAKQAQTLTHPSSSQSFPHPPSFVHLAPPKRQGHHCPPPTPPKPPNPRPCLCALPIAAGHRPALHLSPSIPTRRHRARLTYLVTITSNLFSSTSPPPDDHPSTSPPHPLPPQPSTNLSSSSFFLIHFSIFYLELLTVIFDFEIITPSRLANINRLGSHLTNRYERSFLVALRGQLFPLRPYLVDYPSGSFLLNYV